MNRYCLLVGAMLALWSVRADLTDCLLANGEPIVGVYYYPWFGGEPYRHSGWTPEFQYDNIHNDAHIRAVLRAMTDHGINQASFSYWDNETYLRRLEKHFRQAETLTREGRFCTLSPYLEPRTIDKVFASPAAQDANSQFITTFLEAVGEKDLFSKIGGRPLINIYVTYYRPNETDGDFRSFLQQKYDTIDALKQSWRSTAEGMEQLPAAWSDVTLKQAREGTVAHADRQKLRAQRLRVGWHDVIRRVADNTGLETRYTGDVSRTIVSPVDYMEALTGMSWYSFGYALTNPTRRPKLISEISKYTDTVFLNTIAPGYVDRQQRWGGGRVERTPFLYPYAWVKAIQSLPEGMMILTHSEWYEGSIIDVTKEYGRREYETTELYASIFKAAFPSIYAEKRRLKPIAVVFNEWATYELHAGGRRLDDVYGAIKLLECFSVPFDVIPERFVSPQTLTGRQLVLAPGCGHGLKPTTQRTLAQWGSKTPGSVIVTDVGEPRDWPDGGTCIVPEKDLFRTFHEAFFVAAAQGRAPTDTASRLLTLCRKAAPDAFEDHRQPEPSGQIAAGPTLSAGLTALLPVANVLPWGYIVNHRATGWGLGKGYSRTSMKQWERLPCTFEVPVEAGLPVTEVTACDSDQGRFRTIEYDIVGDRVVFRDHVKFHALYAIVQSPVRLSIPDLAIGPGGAMSVDIRAQNMLPNPFQGTLRLAPTPGLSMMPFVLELAPSESRTFQLTLEASPDYATGNRTVAFELLWGGRRSTWWRPLACSLPACIGTRTGVLAGPAGEQLTRDVTLINVGEVTAENITLQLLDGHTEVRDLVPGDQATVEMTFTMPDDETHARTPDVALRWQADSQDADDGISTRSAADGQTENVERAGKQAVRPVTTPQQKGVNNQMVYFWIDDSELPPGNYNVEAVVEYFDGKDGSFMLEYDSAYGDSIEDRYRDSARITLGNTGKWREAVIPLQGAHFGGRQNVGADLRINGIVAIAALHIRGMTGQPAPRQQEKMVVTYRQFGHERKQPLAIDLVAPRKGEKVGGPLSPYGGHLPTRIGLAEDAVEPVVAADLHISETDAITAVFDRRAGGLACLIDKAANRKVTAFPGPVLPVMLETDDGVRSYRAPADLQWDAARQSLTGEDSWGQGMLGFGWKMTVRDRWKVYAESPRLSLERRVSVSGKPDLAVLAPAVLRLDPERFDMVMPLGVGFSKDGVKRGWLETWVSEGWYMAYRGNPRQAEQAVILTIRPVDGAAETDVGVDRFRYGFMPAEDLPDPSDPGTQSELQCQFRITPGADGKLRDAAFRIDLYILNGVSFEAARELAQTGATPPRLRDVWQAGKRNWEELDGVQTIIPTPPQYMFDVRQPRWLTEIRGDEQ